MHVKFDWSRPLITLLVLLSLLLAQFEFSTAAPLALDAPDTGTAQALVEGTDLAVNASPATPPAPGELRVKMINSDGEFTEPAQLYRYWEGELSTSSTIFHAGDTSVILPGPEDQVRLIVQLQGTPLATVARRMASGPRQLKATEAALLRAYQDTLETQQTQVLKVWAQQSLAVQVNHAYTYLINGLAITVKNADREQLERAPGVQAVYPDYMAQIALSESVPLIGAPQVWAMSDGNGLSVTGQGIRVAVIDTGIDYTHPDLGGCFGAGCKVSGGYDFVYNDPDPMDDHGHGTHVAGIVAANGTLRGVAPEAELLAYKVCDADGRCWYSDIIAALQAAANPDGNPLTSDAVDVANLSLGGAGDPDHPLSQAVDTAVAAGIVVVVAAGNSGPGYQTIGSPGSARQALTVAASDKQDAIAWFSSRGPFPGFYNVVKPDITAPGVGIVSTVPLVGPLGDPSGYRALSGTSMATPHVAGAAALLKQLYPTWTPAMIKDALMNTARDLGQSVHAQGAGRLDVLAAATAQIVIEPPALGFGVTDLSVPVWIVQRALTITNHSGEHRHFTLTGAGNLPNGAAISCTPDSFTLNPGESQIVDITLKVDNAVVPHAAQTPYTYEDLIVVNSGPDIWDVPLMFFKAPLVTFVFDEPPWMLMLHDYQHYLAWISYPSNPLEVLLPEGTYDAIALYDPADTYVFQEGIVVNPDGAVIPFNKSNAIYNVTIQLIDETGQPRLPSYGVEYLVYKATGLVDCYLLWPPGSFPLNRHFSSLSDAYTWEWVAEIVPGNTEPVYSFNGYINNGLNSDLVFQNAPTDLKYQRYQYNLPPNVNEVSVIRWISSAGITGGLSTAVYFNSPPLLPPFVREMYLMPPPYPKFRWRFHYEEVYTYLGNGNGVHLLQTPYLTLDYQTLYGYQFARSIPVLITQAPDLVFGLTPPHWTGKFENSSNQIRLKTALGALLYLYLNQQQDYSVYPDPDYTLYHNSTLLTQGNLSSWNQDACISVDWYLIPCVSYPLPAPDAYTLVIPSLPYYINTMPGLAQATLDFNTALSDRNPPDIYALTIEDDGRPTHSISSLATNAQVRFEVGDDVGLATVTLDYGINGVWTPLALQSTNLPYATAYTAILPALPPDTYVSLRITAIDTSGNQLEYEMNPAFWTIGVQVHVPPLTQALPGTQITIPVILDQDVTGLGIDSYQFTLNFNPAILTPVGIVTANTRSAGWTVLSNFTPPGAVTLAGYHSADLSGSGDLIHLVFNVVGAPGTTSPLTFAQFKFNEGSPSALTQNGLFKVLAPPVTVSGQVRYYQNGAPVPQTTLTFAGTPTVQTTTNSAGTYQAGVGYGAYTATPAKTGDVNGAISALDASLAAQHAVGLITLSPEQVRACDVSGDGSCSAHDAAHIQRYLVLLPTPYPVGEWRFDPTARHYSNLLNNLSGEDYSAYLLGDPSANWTSPYSLQLARNLSPALTLPAIQVPSGATAIIYLEANALAGESIFGYTGQLRYDPAALTPLPSPLVLSNTLSDDWVMVDNAAEPGILRFTGYDLQALSGAGHLVGFAFQVNAPAGTTTPVSLTLRLNEEAWTTLSSEIHITSPGHALYLYLPLVMRAVGGQP